MKDPFEELKKKPNYHYLLEGGRAKLRLAQEVYDKRNKLKLSQQQLAKDIFTTQKVISEIENGNTNSGIEMIAKLKKRLNINIKKVFEKPKSKP